MLDRTRRATLYAIATSREDANEASIVDDVFDPNAATASARRPRSSTNARDWSGDERGEDNTTFMQTLTARALAHVRTQVLAQDIDLLNPPAALEAGKHKLKRLVQSPNSFFMDVKCQGCFNITTVFSHSQTVVLCGSCSAVLCQPTGGKARLTEGCSFRRKGD